MRAASGKALSDSSDADEDADAEGEIDDEEAVEGTMGPPDTPNRLRAARRTRSKSNASQASETSPRMRRRSSSLRERGSGDQALPALEEAPEENEIKTEEMQKAEEAKFAIEQAQRLATKQKEEAEAEAEAKRAEEAEAARLRAEEERKVEEERRRREAEEAEQARKKAAEEAEAERRRQLVRDKEAAEAREAREQRKKELLAALPPSLRHVLQPQSEFTYEGLEEKAYLVQHFTPLRVVRGSGGDDWVLSLQAAALVGKEMGLAMCMGEEFDLETPGFDPDSSERRIAEEVLSAYPTTAKSDADTLMPDEEDDFENELNRTADRLNVLANLQRLLQKPRSDGEDSPLALRLVKLADVRARLHPLLRDVSLEVEHPRQHPPPAVVKMPEEMDVDVFTGMRKLFAADAGATAMDVDAPRHFDWTEVAVVHEK